MVIYKDISDEAKYRFAIVISLLFVMTRFFVPDFFDNEWIYSINPIKLLNPRFLSHDFFSDKIFPFFLFFDALTSPFYYFFDYLTAVFILRILIWSFQLWALSRLTKTLGITWWGFIVLVVIWLNVEQTLAAGDWIIRSANSKPVAYGFMFLAINNLLNNRLKWAGIFSGITISFHILVGFWSTIGLLLTLIVSKYRTINIKEVMSFCIFALLLALPGILPAVFGEFFNYYLNNSQLAASEVARLSVVLANPNHLDPKHFLKGLEYLKVSLFFISTILMMNYLAPRDKARQMALFVLFLCIFFISGVIARHAEWYRFLKYYPFRLADSFVPITFWMGFVIFFQKMIQRFEKNRIFLILTIPIIIGVANYLIDQCDKKPRYHLSLASFTEAMLHTEPRNTAYQIREKGKEWYRFIFNRKLSDLEEVEFWIKDNTPQDSIFISLPWEQSFSLKAQRSEFVAVKPPPNARIIEWMERIETVNRGPLQAVGIGIFYELLKNYPQLTEKEIIYIKCKYGADYFLTNAKINFKFEVAHRNNSYVLYKIKDLRCLESL